MSTEEIIIYGNILDENQNPIFNAIVQIVEIDPKDNATKTSLGYTKTDINGHYTFTIAVSNEMIYQIGIYPPLNKQGK